ncbi:MAG: M28 family peptidase [Chitinophagaceae bacterium]|nr:M28 family peptidase [Chitinophagaceae bacterium]
MRIICIAIFIMASTGVFAQKIANPKKYANIITVEDLKKNLYSIAGDEMEGRETATEGQKKAAAFIENYFKSIGLQPGNNGNYQMTFPVYVDSLINSSIQVNDEDFFRNEDFSFMISSNHSASYNFSEIVFAGFGISDSTRDDYKDIDAKGKLVVVLSPNIAAEPSPQNRKRFNFFTQQEAAMKNGAAALFVVDNKLNPTEDKSNMYINAFQKSVSLNTFFITEKIAAAIMKNHYATVKSATLNNSIASKTFSANVSVSLQKQRITLQSSNVLGLLEGTDLKDEFLVISAHYDHLGVRKGVIWYGADDDGSGTVSILQIAKAFAKAKADGKGPRRSILFMAVSGEEKGLWGSDYYGAHPVYPLEKTSANLNVDMVGRIDPGRKYGDSTNYIYVIGDDKLSSDLKPINESINKKNTKLELDYKYNDPKDPQRIYYRSDHYNFAKRGVPIIFYFSGRHADYHKPTDTPDKINYALMQKRAQLIFYTGWEIANRNAMLKRDIPLN